MVNMESNIVVLIAIYYGAEEPSDRPQARTDKYSIASREDQGGAAATSR